MPREWTPRDLLPGDASAIIGGPLGRRASGRERSLGRLLPLIVLMSVLPISGAVLRQGHCVANGWNGDDQFWRGCFSDLPAQYQLAGLDRGLPAWLVGDVQLEQMPLLSGLMALVGGIVPDGNWLDSSRWYLVIWTLLITVALAVAVWCVGRLRPQRLDLATQLALSPIHVVAALLSPDLVVVTLVLAAMLADARRRTTLAGVLLGLALLGHAWVGLVAIALVVAARRQERTDEAVRTVVIALATAVGGMAVLAIASPDIVLGPLQTWWAEKPGYGSILMIPELAGRPLPDRVAPIVALVGWAGAMRDVGAGGGLQRAGPRAHRYLGAGAGGAVGAAARAPRGRLVAHPPGLRRRRGGPRECAVAAHRRGVRPGQGTARSLVRRRRPRPGHRVVLPAVERLVHPRRQPGAPSTAGPPPRCPSTGAGRGLTSAARPGHALVRRECSR